MRRRRRSSQLPTLPLLWLAAAVLLLPAALAQARPYTLEQLIELARRSNPGLAAGAQATAKVEAQLAEANRSWMPTGELTSLLAPTPNVRCEELPFVVRDGFSADPERYCIHTNINETTVRFRGVFTRTEMRLTQPLFTFGKISAGRQAARQGLAASKSREAGLAADLELNVKKAYYGWKSAQEGLATLQEGLERVEEAQKTIDEELAKGTGSVTQTDKLRMRTVRAELDIRMLEAQKLATEAQAGLYALIGPDAPAEIELDAAPLEAVVVPERPVTYYQEQAQRSRPELIALDNLVASKRALSDLERRKQYPDLVLIGSLAYAYSSNIPNPKNAFLNDPFNTGAPSLGGGLALRMPLDLGVRHARAMQVAAEAEETAQRRREALGGITFEVRRAHSALVEATKRLQAVRSGERAAKAWVTAVGANFAAGLAETRDFVDALVQSFQFRIRALQTIFDLNVAAATLERVTGAPVAMVKPAGAAERSDAQE